MNFDMKSHWNVFIANGVASDFNDFSLYVVLTEPRWPLQPRGTQWFLRIGLFVVRAISLGPCRRPIEFLTTSHLALLAFVKNPK